MENNSRSSSLHIVVLPWVAFGHLNPFLDLAKRIAQLGHLISFISTPTNIERLPTIPPDLTSLIHFVTLPLPAVDGLPPGAENTNDLPGPESVPYLITAFDGLAGPFENFLRNSSPPPDWIIFDFIPYWAPSVATKSGIPSVFLGLLSAAVNAFCGPPSALTGGAGYRATAEELTAPPKWVPFPTSVAYRPYEADKLFDRVFKCNPGEVALMQRQGRSIEDCDVVAMRSCSEFEGEWLLLLEKLYGKPVIPVGHILPAAVENSSGEDGDDDSDGKLEWLKKQEVGSVVYVGFGSEVKFNTEQLHEIANGLELSKLPFLWAIREGSEMLPDGFEERTQGKTGFVCKGWVNQVRLLGHPSVGGFLTHCGGCSIMEGLQFGLALVLLPMQYDQGLNARFLEEKKVGVEIGRMDDGSFVREEIARTLRLVMVEDEGMEVRVGAREVGGVIGNQEVHERHVIKFVEYLKANRRTGIRPLIAG